MPSPQEAVAQLPRAYRLDQLARDDAERALEQLDACRRELERRSLASNTLQGYLGDALDWVTWCRQHRLPYLPTTAETIGHYVEACATGRTLYRWRWKDGVRHLDAREGTLRASTIRRRLAAVVFLHDQALGLHSEIRAMVASPTLQRLLRAHESGEALTRRGRALDKPELTRLAQAERPESTGRNAAFWQRQAEPQAARDRAIVLIGHLCALRAADLARLRYEDLEPHPSGGYLLDHPNPKAGNLRFLLPYHPADALCPTTALEDWLDHRRLRHPDGSQAPGPLFHRLDPGFDPTNPKPLTRQGLARLLRVTAEHAGLEISSFGQNGRWRGQRFLG